MAFLCYGLLVLAWIVDLYTPQSFVAAILLNGPIALSSIALRGRLTVGLVIAAESANAIAGYFNGVQAGHHWDAIALGDRLLLAASFVLVGYMAIETQKHAREAGESMGRMRQVRIERALREATGRVRGTLNVELVRRAVVRESPALIGAGGAMLVVWDAAFDAPLVLEYAAGGSDVRYDRRQLSLELGSLLARARESAVPIEVTPSDALGRLMLEVLPASRALLAPISTAGTVAHVLIETAPPDGTFFADALPALQAFAEQAGIALEQAMLFSQLGERNAQIASQKDELVRRGDVIRDIVYALAHDLRTPLAATEVTIKQALDGAYGALPPRYIGVLRSTLSANDEQRRMVETLLLVARYEAGESSSLREAIDCDDIARRAVHEIEPVAHAKGVTTGTLRAGDEPASVLGDPHEIRRAVVNLVANAVAATPEGGAVDVRTSAGNGCVRIDVIDDGYGVPPDRRPTLFERFGGTRAGAGTGLGLYIVKRIAEKHGGAVTYEPREPRGSTFSIELPSMAGGQ